MVDLKCDGKIAGQLVFMGLDLMLVELVAYPGTYSLPACHCDGEKYIQAGRRAVYDMTVAGIGRSRRVFNENIFDICARVNDPEQFTKHHWLVFSSSSLIGEPQVNAGKIKSISWLSPSELQKLALFTHQILDRYGYPVENTQDVAIATHSIFGTPRVPKKNLSPEITLILEPIWFYILLKIGLIT